MLPAISNLQQLILLLLTGAIFLTQLFCLADIALRQPRAFAVEGKRTKNFWLLVLVAAALFGFLSLGGGQLLFLGFISAVPAIVYLVDVRPAVKPYGRGGSGGSGSGRGSSGGW